LNASLKVCTGLGLVATIEGGEGGFSRIKKIAGKQRPTVIADTIYMKLKNLGRVSSI